MYGRNSHTGTQSPPVVCLADRDTVRRFASPVREVAAFRIEDVVAVLEAVEREAEAGRISVGFVAYEAAPAFDPALCVHPSNGLPLAWFAVFDGDGEVLSPPAAEPEFPGIEWIPQIDAAGYQSALSRIRSWIAAGDTYQVNYTYPNSAEFVGDPWPLFRSMCAAQPTDYGMYIGTTEFAVASVSPELFFELDGDRIVTRPMKGTAPRGLSSADDMRQAGVLRSSEKERAENIMIVDMLRNDLGRIARTGSIEVTSLFDTERHPTVWQMTSTIAAQTGAPLTDVFRALFPSASVTGAPKVRTMQIIHELEPEPRGVYCGALGWIGPGRRARFSVGIRTATIDRNSHTATYHVGSGVTWDSVAAAEHSECRLKSSVLRHRRPRFELLESILWDGDYFLLKEHLARLRESAAYFDIPFDESGVCSALKELSMDPRSPAKVRLLLDSNGRATVEAGPATENRLVTLGVATQPVDTSNVFLYHKTTHRGIYERARAEAPIADDVVLWNARGEVTESTAANVLVRRGDRWYTPPVECGLLPGVMRGVLLREGRIHEARISLEEFAHAEEVALINSVRRWIPARLDRSNESLRAATA